MAKDVTRDHSGGSDPTRTLPLLWRKQKQLPMRTSRRDLTVDRIVTAAIEVADTEGVAALSMRRVADHLDVGTMSLYTYVPGKAELIDLMLDVVYAETDKPAEVPGGWRARLEQVARENWALHARHPWMLQVRSHLPPLGPNVLAKYDYELRALADVGLTEVEMDTVLNLVLGHTETAARRAAEARQVVRDNGMTDDQWWQANGPMLNALMDATRFPTASAVGQAVGMAHGTAHDPLHNFEFGLHRILDGIEALVRSRETPPT